MEVTFVEIQSVFLALFQLQQSAITSRPASYANVRCFVRHLSATLTWFNLVPATAGSDQLCPSQRLFVDHYLFFCNCNPGYTRLLLSWKLSTTNG